MAGRERPATCRGWWSGWLGRASVTTYTEVGVLGKRGGPCGPSRQSQGLGGGWEPQRQSAAGHLAELSAGGSG